MGRNEMSLFVSKVGEITFDDFVCNLKDSKIFPTIIGLLTSKNFKI